MPQIVYFFDKPTIGYCRKCDEIAIYREGLECPTCRTSQLSIFTWNGEGPYPEE
jgi:hypothetical protein